ncbi:MAG: ZIP family metal transporter [Thermotoga sp. 4484_232]|nr:MAG: ZIP family metal transporter [Thermotoga sp. 4484_232]RKX56141.1 MAG: ZIP family metal transporter [Thermotoga sp.]HDG61627.1 ZIP family metal transporter [Thermotoga sp.]
MVEFMRGLPPALQALVATIFTWFMTALGAGMVFFTKEVNRKLLDTMLGFSGGVMIAASYWSLLAPAIEISESMNVPSWLPPATGFLLGGVFLWGIDRILPHLHLGFPMEEAEGIKTNLKRTTLLVLAITIHNIPEGLAIGVAFGALASNMEFTTLVGAISLAVGIGIQNFPEGLAVSMPLRREGLSVFKSFWYGQLSGVVEPIASILGALTVTASHAILPYALSFAAGAMIYVTVEELIPESQRSGNTDLATLGLMLGFTTMMILDVTFS